MFPIVQCFKESEMLACFESPLFKHYKVFSSDVVATFTATAPSPQRDFIHLQILKDKVEVLFSLDLFFLVKL